MVKRNRTSPLGQLASRINTYLKRFEADPEINQWSPERQLTDKTRPYFNAGCGYAGGNRIHICYISYQGNQTITKADAEKYLAWLDAGNVGRHHEAVRADRVARGVIEP